MELLVCSRGLPTGQQSQCPVGLGEGEAENLRTAVGYTVGVGVHAGGLRRTTAAHGRELQQTNP